MPSALLAVKFFIPRPGANLTERSALIERFEAGLHRPLTLISAPAGFGKSTLVSVWIDRQRTDAAGLGFTGAAWLSLDDADDDPQRFWLYAAAALKNAGGAESGAAMQPLAEWMEMLLADSPPPAETMLDELINSLVQLPGMYILVLDDYHVIHSPRIHEQMAYLLEHLPPNLRLVIITRADPPLPLTRLRARGQLSEFRSADLRFSRVEADAFLRRALGLAIAEEDLNALEESTEGWIAGLQMAALALQLPLAEAGRAGREAQETVHAFIGAFSGKNVFILDYLVDEVFNRQPPDVQDFLLKTALLEKMSAELCDAVLQDGAAARGSRAILEYLERANLFLIPLDFERQWFRYHHLFADLLRARLGEAWPGLRPVLLARASAWFERSGSQEEAIHYALAAEDWDRAALLMERHIQSFLELGQLSKIMDWVGRLPAEAASRRPGLLIQQAWLMGIANRKETLFSLLDAAEERLAHLPGEDSEDETVQQEYRRMQISLQMLRGYQLVMQGKPQQALVLLNELLQYFPTGSLWEDTWMYWECGYANRAAGNLDEAVANLRQALDFSRKRLWVDMVCCTDLGMVYHLQGALDKASAVYQEGLALGKYHTRANHGYLNRVLGAYCAVLLDRNELEEASRQGQAGLEWVKWWPSANSRALLFTTLGRVRLAQGDLTGAEALIGQADRERRELPLNPINDSQVEDALVRLWLAAKDMAAVDRWVAAFRQANGDAPRPGQSLDESQEIRWTALARARLAQAVHGNRPALDAMLQVCEQLGDAARRSGRVRSLVEISVLQALGLQWKTAPKGERWDPAALACMETALFLGETGGLLRVFLDEGPRAAEMLRALRSRPARFSMPYLNRILAAFEDGQHTGAAETGAAATVLVEPLTQREQEVLLLMSGGLSNREMAEKLVLSEGTIKSHVHNLIAKLGAQNRTHALALARQLDLLR